MKKQLFSLIKPDIKKNIFKIIIAVISGICRSGILLFPPIITQKIIDEVIPDFSSEKLIIYSISLIIIPFIIMILYGIDTYLNKFVFQITCKIKVSVFNGILKQKTSHRNELTESELLNYSVDCPDNLGELYFLTTSNLIWYISTVIIGLIFMIKLNLIITISIIIIALFQLLLTQLLKKRYSKISKDRIKLNSSFINIVLKSFNYNSEFKLNKNSCENLYNDVDTANQNFKKNELDGFNADLIIKTLNRAFSLAELMIIYFIGITLIREGNMTIGRLVALISYFNWVSPVILNLQNWIVKLFQSIPNWKKVENVLTVPQNTIGKIRPNEIKNIAVNDLSKIVNDEIIFNNLSFKLDSSRVNVVLGDSGTGKSTLCDILFGIQFPSKGEVIINDYNLNSVDSNWFIKHSAYVLQKTTLLNGSLREYLKIGNQNVSDEEIYYLLRKLHLYNLIVSLPNKLDSSMQVDVANFSDGEKRRLSIIQALLKKPQFIILDEPTAGIDEKIKYEIMMFLRAYLSNSIVLLITHDKNILSGDDNIINLDG